jgi:signal transduction histidine kinase
MNQLINDLLAYSRLERRMVVVTPVHVRELVEQILEEKAIELNERNVQVDLHFPCETIAAEIEGLTQALRNLIDNALKFTHETAEPRIEIRCESQEEGCLVWVKDNGIGFEMQYHDRIFEIFQRLHRSEDYPGTGIGLALVRKAMLRMGGRVWAESEPGRGATFYLLFPWRDMENIASSQ